MAQEIPSAEQVAGVFRDILAHPDFIEFEVRQSFLGFIWDTFGKWFREFLRWLVEAGAGSPWASLTVLIVILVLVVLLGHLASRHAPRLVRQIMEAEAEGDHVALTVQEWLDVSLRRAREGALRPAATALYQGWILNLDRQGTLMFHDSKTPGDYQAEFPGGRRFLESFQAFAFGKSLRTVEGFEALLDLARDSGCPIDGIERES